MGTELWRLVLITSFGRYSPRPFRAALFRLSLLIGLSILIGLFFSRALLKYQLATDIPVVFAAALISLISFITVGMVLLVISSASVRSAGHGQPSLAQQAALWPLTWQSRWLLETLPALIIWVILMIGGSWLTITASQITQQPLGAALPALYFGGLSALLLNLWRYLRSAFYKTGLFTIVSIIGSLSLEAIIKYDRLAYAVGLFIPQIAIICGYLYLLSKPIKVSAVKPAKLLLKLPGPLLAINWFILKIIRNRRSTTSLAFGLILTFVTAVIIQLRHLPSDDRLGWLFIGALAGLALACDIRGLSRRNRALEIEGLRQLNYFLRDQLFNLWLVAIFVGLPLLVISWQAPFGDAMAVTGLYLSIQLLAVSCGLLGSTVTVPQVGDFGSQFFAGTIASLFFIALLKVLALFDVSTFGQIPGLVALAVLGWLAIYIIEFRRRLRYGHA